MEMKLNKQVIGNKIEEMKYQLELNGNKIK